MFPYVSDRNKTRANRNKNMKQKTRKNVSFSSLSNTQTDIEIHRRIYSSFSLEAAPPMPFVPFASLFLRVLR